MLTGWPGTKITVVVPGCTEGRLVAVMTLDPGTVSVIHDLAMPLVVVTIWGTGLPVLLLLLKVTVTVCVTRLWYWSKTVAVKVLLEPTVRAIGTACSVMLTGSSGKKVTPVVWVTPSLVAVM